MDPHPVSVFYIPESDREALAWMERFSRTLTPRPSAFGVDPRDIASLDELIRDFRDRLALAESAAERTSPGSTIGSAMDAMGGAGGARAGGAGNAVNAKVLARNAAVLVIQRLVQTITAHPLTTDEDFLLLGLREKHDNS